jgi:hypothetical protein
LAFLDQAMTVQNIILNRDKLFILNIYHSIGSHIDFISLIIHLRIKEPKNQIIKKTQKVNFLLFFDIIFIKLDSIDV